MVSQQEAREMREAIRLVEQTEGQVAQAKFNADLGVAQAWYNTVERPEPTTRQQALDKFNHIKSLLETETDNFRLGVLRIELKKANEKYREVKRNG